MRQLGSRAGWFPEVDLFATSANSQVTAAVSLFPERGCRTNAFFQDWAGVRAWAFPPFSQIPRVFEKLASATDARLLLVVPRTTVVPSAVRVKVCLLLADNLRLIASDGAVGHAPCPTRLMVIDVRGPDP